jgi:hypothetical protein
LIEQPLLTTFNGRVEGILVRGMTVADIRRNEVLGGKVGPHLDHDRTAAGQFERQPVRGVGGDFGRGRDARHHREGNRRGLGGNQGKREKW